MTAQPITAPQKSSQKQVTTINQEVQPLPQATTALTGFVMPVEAMEKLAHNLVDGGDLEKIKQLRDLYEEERSKMAEQAFNQAMARLQAEMPIVKKTKASGMTREGKAKGYYAPYEQIVKTTRDAITKNGFSWRFDTEERDGKLYKHCVVNHIAGHSTRTTMVLEQVTIQNANAMQNSAGAHTYANRYTFTNAFGIAIEDEDTDAQMQGGADGSHIEEIEGIIAKATARGRELAEQIKTLQGDDKNKAIIDRELIAKDYTTLMNTKQKIIKGEVFDLSAFKEKYS